VLIPNEAEGVPDDGGEEGSLTGGARQGETLRSRPRVHGLGQGK